MYAKAFLLFYYGFFVIIMLLLLCEIRGIIGFLIYIILFLLKSSYTYSKRVLLAPLKWRVRH
jgi:hypothetical protein